MNITEYTDHARPTERDGCGGVGRREADIECFAVIVRKSNVENEIAIGEIHRGSERDGEHVRSESLVLLQHFGAAPGGHCDGSGKRFEPNYDARIIQVLA